MHALTQMFVEGVDIDGPLKMRHSQELKLPYENSAHGKPCKRCRNIQTDRLALQLRRDGLRALQLGNEVEALPIKMRKPKTTQVQ
jgi:hypothetical protein